jgi:hypothetical protein
MSEASSESYEARYFTASAWRARRAGEIADYVEVELNHGRATEELELWLKLSIAFSLSVIAREAS